MRITIYLFFILLFSAPLFISCGDDDENEGEPNVIDQVINKRWIIQSMRYELCDDPSIFDFTDCQDPNEDCDSFELTESELTFYNSGEVDEVYSLTKIDGNTIEICDFSDDCITIDLTLAGEELTLNYTEGEGDDCERTIVVAQLQ